MTDRPEFLRKVYFRLPAIGIFVGGLIVWEGVVRAFDIKGFILPAPTAIAATFASETSDCSRRG